MEPLFDPSAPKKPTNVRLNSDLLKKSRALNINISATLEQALADKLSRQRSEEWAKENKNAIKAYNEFIEENGCFSDEHRTF